MCGNEMRILGCQRCGGMVDRQSELPGHWHGVFKQAEAESAGRQLGRKEEGVIETRD